jgi:hypothetical protein
MADSVICLTYPAKPGMAGPGSRASSSCKQQLQHVDTKVPSAATTAVPGRMHALSAASMQAYSPAAAVADHVFEWLLCYCFKMCTRVAVSAGLALHEHCSVPLLLVPCLQDAVRHALPQCKQTKPHTLRHKPKPYTLRHIKISVISCNCSAATVVDCEINNSMPSERPLPGVVALAALLTAAPTLQ